MARTDADIAFTDQLAADIGYVAPPPGLEPTGRVDEDLLWTDLVNWYRGQEIAWASAIEVYISRRYDASIQTVYADIDSWKKSQIDRIDRAEDSDAVVSFN